MNIYTKIKRKMKQILLLLSALLAVPAMGQDLQLNDLEYFERQGVNVLVFSNSFNGGFNDEKNSGIEIIHQVPLLRGVVQTHGTALYGTHTMMDDLNARVLLVVETAVETIAEHQHVDTLTLEILAVVELQVLTHRRQGQQGCE